MKHPILIVLLCALGTHISGPVSAQPTGAEPRASVLADSLLEHFPGLSVAVGRGDSIVWTEGIGWAHLATKAPVTPSTRFRVLSVAKKWTATAAAKLIEAGKMGMHVPIQKYVPSFPEKEYTITPYQLATHTAGIRHYKNEEEATSSRICETIEEALSIFADDSLQFEPSTQSSYSTWGFVLLSAAIAGASEESYLTYMQRAIFNPSGMDETVYATSDEHQATRATFYERASYERAPDGGRWRVTESGVSCKWGGGGFLSTARDVTRFYMALMQGKMVGPEMTAMILRAGDDGIARAQGVSAGGRALVWANTRRDIIVTLLANARGTDISFDQLARVAGTIAERFDH